MDLEELNNDYLPNLSEKLSLENETLVTLKDFNINLLKYDIAI